MKKLVCGILVVLFLLLSACASGSDFDTLLREANALHKAQLNMVPESSIHNFIPSLPDTDVGFTEEELISLTKNLNRVADEKKFITINQAKHDIDLLFRTLRFCYGPYEYFGGDYAFEEAQTAILYDIGTFGASFQIGKLVEVLRNRLSFVQDGHFTINGRPVVDMYSYFSSEELEFAHDKTGYYAMIDDAKHYISAVGGDTNIETYMKRSISSDGRLVYYIGMLSKQTAKQLTVSVTLENSVRELTLSKVVEQQIYDTMIPYSADWDTDVPVVTCTDYTQEDAFRSFVGAAIRLRDEPIAILDLRGNGGGDADAVQAWLNNYDYKGIAKNLYGKGYYYLTTRASNYIFACNLSSYSFPTAHIDPYDYLMDLYQSGENGYIVQKDEAELKWNSGKGLLFVLMDSRTISGGEWLLAVLRTRGNVVFVGTNSAGMILGSLGQNIALPNSRIYISSGSSLLLSYDERVFQEGRGFLPDVWVNGDALERVQKLIEYYGVE